MRPLKNIFLALILIPIIGCAQQDTSHTISVIELKKQMETDSTLVILDVRTEPELSGPLGHIDGIVHIPLQELSERTDELEKYKNQPIAVICRSGNRSGVATNILVEKGFKAKNVLGGMKAWNSEILKTN